jgi:hypothetical protein
VMLSETTYPTLSTKALRSMVSKNTFSTRCWLPSPHRVLERLF